MSQYIYLDVETLPSLELPDISELKVPGTMKKPETIAAWWADPERQDDLEKLHHKTSVDPFAGRIFCVAWAINNDPIQVLWNDDEETLLRQWNDWFENLKNTSRRRYESLSTTHVVGYNIKNFDNPYLRLRAIKYKLSALKAVLPTREFPKLIEDMMEMSLVTTRLTADKYVSQDKVARYFGLPGKGEMDGSMVWDYYKQGKKQEIANYCMEDVDQCRQLHQLFVDPNYMEE